MSFLLHVKSNRQPVRLRSESLGLSSRDSHGLGKFQLMPNLNTRKEKNNLCALRHFSNKRITPPPPPPLIITINLSRIFSPTKENLITGIEQNRWNNAFLLVTLLADVLITKHEKYFYSIQNANLWIPCVLLSSLEMAITDYINGTN